MNNIATYARIQHYGDGSPDPRTATCRQHECAAPYSDTAKGEGANVPESNGWPCVVCPLPEADLIGTEVMVTQSGHTSIYGGPDERERGGGWISTAYSMRYGGSVVTCDVECVAPADTPVNEKDPRITIEKLPKKRDYQDAGVWLPHIDHPALSTLSPTAKKTKRDALTYAARRLAIADYHADLAESHA